MKVEVNKYANEIIHLTLVAENQEDHDILLTIKENEGLQMAEMGGNAEWLIFHLGNDTGKSDG